MPRGKLLVGLASLALATGCAASDTGPQTTVPSVAPPNALWVGAVVLSSRPLPQELAGLNFASPYEVQIAVDGVMAGGDFEVLEGRRYVVRLMASNGSALREGAEITVLLDPDRMQNGDFMDWRPFVRFACVSSRELSETGLAVSAPDVVESRGDVCLRYGS